jgi:hypothetical protein
MGCGVSGTGDISNGNCVIELVASGAAKNRRLLRRIQQIDQLPKRDQEALLRTN